MSDIQYTCIPSPIGDLTLVASAKGLRGVYMEKHEMNRGSWIENPGRFGAVIRQLNEYFAGKRKTFDLPLDLAGTPFQIQAWQALMKIPYGETRSYGEQAALIDKPKAVRAIGLANGRNPVSIIVPCHRVIGKNGSLTGYGGGLGRKRFLLELEGVAADFTSSSHISPSSAAA